MIGDLFDSPWKILILAAVILVLFGSRKLPDAARSLGKSMRILKSEISTLHDDETPAASAAPVTAGPQPSAITHQRRVDQLQQQLDELRNHPAADAQAAQAARPAQPAQQVS